MTLARASGRNPQPGGLMTPARASGRNPHPGRLR